MKRATRATVLLLLALVVGSVLLPVTGADAALPSIVPYIQRKGDQIVTVPNGTYSGGVVNTPHAKTTGPYRGWLILQAQSKHGVVVDLEGQELDLDWRTSRVMFVGFKFVNGSVHVSGSDIRFWYTDHSFPVTEWIDQAPDPNHPEDGYYRVPRLVYADNSSTLRVKFFGADLHDACDGIDIDRSTALALTGVKMWGMTEPPVDPDDVCHADAIDGASGGSRSFQVSKSDIEGRIMLADRPDNTQSYSGDAHRGLLFVDSWFHESRSSGFIFTSRKETTPRGVYGTRRRINTWDHQGTDRWECVDGTCSSATNWYPERVNVVDDTVTRAAPASGTVNPADKWRTANPYTVFKRYLP